MSVLGRQRVVGPPVGRSSISYDAASKQNAKSRCVASGACHDEMLFQCNLMLEKSIYTNPIPF